eukprot:8932_1
MVTILTAFIYSAVMLIQSSNVLSASMSCYSDSSYVNDMDGDHESVKTNYFFSGLYSYHNNHNEDRRFKWRYCRTTGSSGYIGPFQISSGKSVKLTETAYDEEWRKSCGDGDINGGHAAIHGIESSHDNGKEDRKYTIYCGLLDLSKHRIDNCHDSDQLNNYDGTLDYDCPNDGVIRSIWSHHDNGKEDRIFKFECCNIIDITYEFDDIIGSWEKKTSCLGCGQTEYRKDFGTDSTITETIESSYSRELSATVSVGYTQEIGWSSSIAITGTVSQSTAKAMETAFTTSYSEGTTYTCAKTYFYQWVLSGEEKRSDGTSGTFTVYSNDYLCSNVPEPKCPPQYCQDEPDCQICIN